MGLEIMKHAFEFILVLQLFIIYYISVDMWYFAIQSKNKFDMVIPFLCEIEKFLPQLLLL